MRRQNVRAQCRQQCDGETIVNRADKGVSEVRWVSGLRRGGGGALYNEQHGRHEVTAHGAKYGEVQSHMIRRVRLGIKSVRGCLARYLGDRR